MIVRVLRTAKSTLTRSFYLDEDQTLPSGSVAVSVMRLDGTVVQSGNATGPDPDTGVFAFTFDGSDTLDELLVSWSVTLGGDPMVLDQDVIEVVGGFYFGLAEGRAVDPSLSSTAKFPTGRLIEVRTEVEAECERITEQAWVPRFRRVEIPAPGSSVLALPDTVIRAVRSVTVDGVAVTGSAVGAAGLLIRDGGRLWERGAWVAVEYEHGHDRPNPDILRAAKLRFKSLALEGRSAAVDRAERTVRVEADGGSVVYGSATAEKTGIPAVDAAYGRWPSPRPGFG